MNVNLSNVKSNRLVKTSAQINQTSVSKQENTGQESNHSSAQEQNKNNLETSNQAHRITRHPFDDNSELIPQLLN